jgi:regulator of sirC expression with transglutaminase-like and TPR domain
MQGRALAAAAAVLLLGSAGCATAARQIYTPAQLREVLAATPGIPPADVVVPYELPPEALERARRLVIDARTDREKVERLVQAMFDPAAFALRQDVLTLTTTTGAEALAAGQGNCVALASIFIGLARAVGLDARYVDASSRVHEKLYGDDGSTVDFGHVSAIVNTGTERIGLDFARLGPVRWYDQLDDLEALAHFYNNRGYELVEEAREAGAAPDWAEAERRYRLAVAVKPGFARAWNNLGIAAARQGRTGEAMGHYLRAAALAPSMAAPHANLGAAYLQAGDLPAALRELDVAARLDPQGAHIQYNLALARLRSGDREGAREALRRALELRGSYPGAQALMERLAPGAPGAGGG